MKEKKIDKKSNFYCIRSKIVSNMFRGLKNVKIARKSSKIGQLLPILATFYQFFKFQFDVFWIYMLWDIQN
jgi:Na+-driven multidrug efflux pump